jgi:hypothetical protein
MRWAGTLLFPIRNLELSADIISANRRKLLTDWLDVTACHAIRALYEHDWINPIQSAFLPTIEYI